MEYNAIHSLAQTKLREEGFYGGEIDGKWGPLSKAALKAWRADQREKAEAVNAGPAAETPYSEALRHKGVKEIPGKKHNPLIVRWLRACISWVSDDETAWCSAFVDHCARVTGYEHTGKLNARSWLNAGLTVARQNARRGDVVVLWRVSKNSWQGHVAFLDHINKRTGRIYLLGGNQNNRVNVTSYPLSRVLSIRRLRTLEKLEGRHSGQV